MYRKTRRIRRNKRRTRRRTHRSKMRGGGGIAASIPSAFMASTLGAPYNSADMMPAGNHYAYNPLVQQWPSPSNTGFNMNGGRRRKRTHQQKRRTRYKYKKQRGGGITEFVTALLPQEIVNIGRSVPASVGHMYDRFNGATPSASSMVYPTNQPLVKNIYMTDAGTAPVDLTAIYNSKNNIVSTI